jgi:hypothetical protein
VRSARAFVDSVTHQEVLREAVVVIVPIPVRSSRRISFHSYSYGIRRAQVKMGLINLCKGLFSLNARIYYKLKSGT